MTAALAVGCSGKEESGNRKGDTTGEENTAGITFLQTISLKLLPMKRELKLL